MGYSSIIESISMAIIDLLMILVCFVEGVVVFLLLLVAGFLTPFFVEGFKDVLLICFNEKSTISYFTSFIYSTFFV